jgi:hypothetical protein
MESATTFSHLSEDRPRMAPWIGITAAVLAGLVLLVGLMLARRPRFRRGSIMTVNEREFHGRLEHAFPDCQVWPQIPILSLVRPDARHASRAFWTAFRAISNTRVDWVIVKDMEVVAVIELDDRTHDPRKDARRDRILNACGYRVLRFDSARRPDSRQIRQAVLKRGSRGMSLVG